ncbi:hypothetical protein Pmani_036519 [Petrolisthes manimaculis]|uniref:IRS-type PTB domain-containing protein n=1 Tax=Petrolisthes manimaculis TaxID=1843537 RepID=A0AAE1NIK3_9EUCA|nr:hypothetical protein Pmani_036519 [Petrolisthes manimaculis]
MKDENQFCVGLSKDTWKRLEMGETNKNTEKDQTRRDVALLLQTGRITLTRNGIKWWDWTMGNIRRYGHDLSCFYFEAGRKARSGEGIFILCTDQGKLIHQQLTAMKTFYQFDTLCQRGMDIEKIALKLFPQTLLSSSISPATMPRSYSHKDPQGSEQLKRRSVERWNSVPCNVTTSSRSSCDPMMPQVHLSSPSSAPPIRRSLPPPATPTLPHDNAALNSDHTP